MSCTPLISILMEMLGSVLSQATIFSCFQQHLPGLSTHAINLEGKENFPKECSYSIDQFCLCSLKLGLPLRPDFASVVLQIQGFCDKICFLPLYVSVTLQYQCVVNVCRVILLGMQKHILLNYFLTMGLKIRLKSCLLCCT